MTTPYIDDIIIFLIFSIIAFIIPSILTIWNIYNCCSQNPKKEELISSLTVFIGGFFYMLLHVLEYDEAGDWYEQINTAQVHNSISSEYAWLAGVIILIGIMSLFTLMLVDADKLPPLVSALSVAALILFNVFQIVYAIQISRQVDGIDWLFYVYHANILLLSANAVRRQIKQQVRSLKERTYDIGEHKAFGLLFYRMKSISEYTIFIFVFLFFIIAVMEIIFVLAGQGLDAPVKAFTETADWTFSKQLPPPPVEYEGHYLCTVAAAGHKKLVKPLRFGKRKNVTIIVNRQLCIANAFEEYIQEKFPVFHRNIRYLYDTYGYPLSEHITSPLRADIIYILMKPLEWAFLLFLYLVDVRPEERIRRQYK